jgi:hypothetical protein
MSITSKSSDVYEAKDMAVFPRATAETATLPAATAPTGGAPPTKSARQRMEQMYELADIFVSIFEALPDEHEHAIAATSKAA